MAGRSCWPSRCGVSMRTAIARSLGSAERSPSTIPHGPLGGWLEFAGHLARKQFIKGDFLSEHGAVGAMGRERKLRDLWELTDLSASDFATEIATFYKLSR